MNNIMYMSSHIKHKSPSGEIWRKKGKHNTLLINLFLSISLKAPAKRSQHANATYCNIVGRNIVWPPCCDVLRHIGCFWLKFENGQLWASNTQHVATCCNTVAKRTQHVAPNNVAICCVGMLRSFGRGLTHALAHNSLLVLKPRSHYARGIWKCNDHRV